MGIANFNQCDLLGTIPFLYRFFPRYRFGHGGVVFETDQPMDAILLCEDVDDAFAIWKVVLPLARINLMATAVVPWLGQGAPR